MSKSAFLEFALAYAKRGWAVFPLAPFSKHPLPGSQGLKDATTDESIIRAWWQKNPQANIGVNCGMSDLVVLDVDTKGDKRGGESLLELVGDSYELLETVIATTWSGGRHYFYEGKCASSASQLAADLDIRGEGGYIVLAPSVIRENGVEGKYAWVNPGEKQELLDYPDIFRPTARKNAVVTTDETKFAPGSRNASLASMAGKLRRGGFSADEILGALKVCNEKRCDPPLTDREVAQVAKSVARYEPATIVEQKNAVAVFRPMTMRQLFEQSEKEEHWIIEELLRADGLMMLAAAPGVGKSDLARNLARAVAMGGDYLSRRCKQGRVLWIGLEESQAHFRERAEAMGLQDLDILIIDELPAMPKLQWLDTILAEYKPTMTIIDTFGRFFDIKDINHYSEVTTATEGLNALRRKHNTAIVMLHHTNKANNILGSQQIAGTMDVTQIITRNEDNTRVTKTEKIRGGTEMEPTVLSFDPESYIITASAPVWLHQQRKAEQNILFYLRNVKRASRQDLADHSGAKSGVGRKAVDALTSAGLIIGSGEGTRSSPRAYSLATQSSINQDPRIPREHRTHIGVPEVPELPEESNGSINWLPEPIPTLPDLSRGIPRNPELPEVPELPEETEIAPLPTFADPRLGDASRGSHLRVVPESGLLNYATGILGVA